MPVTGPPPQHTVTSTAVLTGAFQILFSTYLTAK